MRHQIFLRYLAGSAVVFLLWALGSLVLGPAVLPDPVSAVVTFSKALTEPDFLGHIASSSWRLGAGVLVAVLTAFPLGVLLGHSRRADWLGGPVTFITFPLPKIVLLPVFFTALGLGDASRILLIALAAGYQLLVIVRESALSLTKSYELAMASMGAGIADRVVHVYIPAALPSLFVGLKAASGTAVAVLFLAESFATDSGLGWFIMNAWGLGDINGMFAGILGMSALGLALYGLVSLMERICCPWTFAAK